MDKPRYEHARIEQKWQERWAKEQLYRTTEDPHKEKAYVLDMFPYPSGEGLHVGHPKGYIATDIYSRYMRMRGFSVLHPMGWDAFGLPAENFALKNKIHPRIAVEKNIAHFKEQLGHIGLDYDWTREINTTDPSYYKWTQWIFLKMLEQGIAYQSNEPINWCPSCMTGLANEDLEGSVCERCGTPVEKKRLPQWVLKITDYADRLLDDLALLDKWPTHIKEAQRNWIGRSEGAEIKFPILGSPEQITVFTTRPETLFGVTYLVLAPEHPLVTTLLPVITNKQEVLPYIQSALAQDEITRTTTGREKTGVVLEGIQALHPVTKESIPVYIADYVLSTYGTGAIMGVPAHDERDFAFAQKMHLPIREVVMPRFIDERNPHQTGKELVERDATISVVYDPQTDTYLCLKWSHQPWTTFITGGVEDNEDPREAAQREIAEETGYHNLTLIAELGHTRSEFFASHKDVNRIANNTTYLFTLTDRDQLPISQHEKETHTAVWLTRSEIEGAGMQHAEFALIWQRVLAQHMTPYTGEEGILINSGEFSGTVSTESRSAMTNQFGRMKVVFKIRDWVFSRQRYWGEPIPVIHCEKDGAVPVPYEDLPVVLPEVAFYEPSGTGESPLAAITDWVHTTCPRCGGPAKRETNTMPQWAGSSWYYLRFMDPHDTEQLVDGKKERYWNQVDVYVGGDHAVRHLIYARFWHKFLYDIGIVGSIEPFNRLEFLGFILAEDGRKMSKRAGNVINPDDVIATYGADSFRLYEMFMGPFENTTAWDTSSIAGTSRFFERVWQLHEKIQEKPIDALETPLHQTLKKVSEDIEHFKFNTAVSTMMIFLNAVEAQGSIGKEQWKLFLQVLAPFAPHITEELWERLGETESIHISSWPAYDPSLLMGQTVTVVVQVNGKRRGSVELSPTATEKEALEAGRAVESVRAALEGRTPSRCIYVPGKIINLVL